MYVLSIAFSLFLLMDSVGNVPLYITFLKGIDPHRQRRIIYRELLIALAIIVLFAFVGDRLMKLLGIQQDAVQISGGIILFLLCLKMIFPASPDQGDNDPLPRRSEPFIVPLAIPLVAGPGVLAAVMLYASQEPSFLVTLAAILLAWFASLLILLSAPWLQHILGWRGLTSLERLMGLILALISIQMFLSGVAMFIQKIFF